MASALLRRGRRVFGGPGAIRTFGWVVAVSLLGGAASADTVVVPAAASVRGLDPFFSDVRVFNTSYVSNLEVTATYRCFLSDCPGTPPQAIFSLAPREAAAFDGMVDQTFHAPNSGGGIEFVFDGPASQLVVTSRLYSTEP